MSDGGKRPENHFCGMLIIRKEPGYTSSDVVAKLRGILHMRRIGHTGTLDPMAEGVLPVCLGNATKLADFIADRDKEYVARLRLGVTTDTQDMTGTVLEEKSAQEVREILLRSADSRDGAPAQDAGASWIPDAAQSVDALQFPDPAVTDACLSEVPGPEQDAVCLRVIRAAAAGFVGEIGQIPPMYSAVWSNGKRLYDLARKGVTVERKPRRVVISELEIQDAELPYVTLRVVCSKGTYIRTLCEDLGNALGTGGAMEHLLRTRVGSFSLEEALTLGEVQRLMEPDPAAPPSGTEDGIENHIIPVDRFFAADPAVHVRDEDLKFLQNGNPLSGANTLEGRIPHAERVRVYDAHGEFYALYRYEKSRRRILPVKMFHDTESVRHDRR